MSTSFGWFIKAYICCKYYKLGRSATHAAGAVRLIEKYSRPFWSSVGVFDDNLWQVHGLTMTLREHGQVSKAPSLNTRGYPWNVVACRNAIPPVYLITWNKCFVFLTNTITNIFDAYSLDQQFSNLMEAVRILLSPMGRKKLYSCRWWHANLMCVHIRRDRNKMFTCD